jgi:hypothetical protein
MFTGKCGYLGLPVGFPGNIPYNPSTLEPWSPGGPGGQAALDAAIVITTPQQLSLVDVEKGIRSLARCDSAPGNGEALTIGWTYLKLLTFINYGSDMLEYHFKKHLCFGK